MTTLIQIKRSDSTGVTPNTTNSGNTSYIASGELAINLPDGKLFSSNGSVLIEVGANLNIIKVGSNNFFANSTVVKLTTNDTLTFADNTTQNTAFRVYDSSGSRIA
jgi:hypothetical protein